MATVATVQMLGFAQQWKKLFKSAVFSGICGDPAHAAKGGYHISREDQKSNQNYSVTRPDDRGGPDDTASAVDMSMNPADMKLATSRLIAIYSDSADPRRRYFNAFNGYTGSGHAQRWDIKAARVGTASSDHESHVHLEFCRRYCNSPAAMRAGLSALSGESKAAYLASIGVRSSTAVAATAKPPAYPGHVLKLGCKEPAVKLLKARMIARGWTSLGTADTSFDAQLVTVMKAFQKQRGVDADGIVGPRTWPLPWTSPVG